MWWWKSQWRQEVKHCLLKGQIKPNHQGGSTISHSSSIHMPLHLDITSLPVRFFFNFAFFMADELIQMLNRCHAHIHPRTGSHSCQYLTNRPLCALLSRSQVLVLKNKPSHLTLLQTLSHSSFTPN